MVYIFVYPMKINLSKLINTNIKVFLYTLKNYGTYRKLCVTTYEITTFEITKQLIFDPLGLTVYKITTFQKFDFEVK